MTAKPVRYERAENSYVISMQMMRRMM